MKTTTEISFFKTIQRLIQPIFPVKKYWIQWFLGGLYDAFQAIIIVQVWAAIITVIQSGDTRWLIIWSSVFLVIKLIANITDPFLAIANDKLWIYMESNLMTKYFKKYIHLDNTKVESIGTGKIENIVFDGINNRVQLNTAFLINASVDVLWILYALIIIFVSVPIWYFLLIIWLLIVSFVIMQHGYKKTEEIRTDVAALNQEISRKRIQIIMSKFEILQNKKINNETDKLYSIYDTVAKLWAKQDLTAESWTALWAFMLHLTNALIYLVIWLGVIRGSYTLAEFVLMIGLMDVIQHYIWNIRRYIRQYNKAIIPVRQLWKTFETIPKIQNMDDFPSFVYKTWTIDIKNLWFAYDTTNIFSSFDIHIDGGKKTAFVWPSWSGKTTLIKLLAGYISPNDGQIIVDGQIINEINIQTYYAQIGYLTQDPSVFDGTIRDNLIYWVSNPNKLTKKKIKEILLSAKCNFIFEFEKWRDTEIWERGIRLSGGQKQRLAIAKIMLKNPKIVFLDEPTSAMDSFNEEEVVQALHNLFEWRTVVVVAHRLQTVKQADKIYYLEASDHGAQIIEQWTHNELVKKNGKYKKMLDLQSWF